MLDENETIISSWEYRDYVIVTTTKRVFRAPIQYGKLVQIEYEFPKIETPAVKPAELDDGIPF